VNRLVNVGNFGSLVLVVEIHRFWEMLATASGVGFVVSHAIWPNSLHRRRANVVVRLSITGCCSSFLLSSWPLHHRVALCSFTSWLYSSSPWCEPFNALIFVVVVFSVHLHSKLATSFFHAVLSPMNVLSCNNVASWRSRNGIVSLNIVTYRPDSVATTRI